MNSIPVIVIFAPTASGKTSLVLKLFASDLFLTLKGKAEIISADSMQVYRKMNIGTAKPTLQELSALPHHLINIKNPNEQFSVAEFVERADVLCKDIFLRNKIPVVAGGTGFYIRNFLLGLPTTPESCPKIRSALKEEFALRGKDELFKELCAIDKESAQKINPNDTYRILRALEVYRTTGKIRSAFKQQETLRTGYDFFTIILERERSDLYERIEARVDEMFNAGLEKEVALLKDIGYTLQDPGIKAIGYHEFFEGGTLDEIKARIKRDSKKYAKKQYIYMKGLPNARIYYIPCSSDGVKEVSGDIIKWCENH